MKNPLGFKFPFLHMPPLSRKTTQEIHKIYNTNLSVIRKGQLYWINEVSESGYAGFCQNNKQHKH